MCAGKGCQCDEVATRDYGGSGGTTAQCNAVLTALGAPSDPGISGFGCSTPRGCYFDQLVFAAGRNLGNEWLIPFVVTARWTGARRDEFLTLERRQLDLRAGKLTLDPGTTKNGEGSVIYLPAHALAALMEWDATTCALERDRGIIVRYVFHRHGRGPISEFPYTVWHDACAKAGLPGRRWLHDFRRTAARSYRRSGVSEGVVMKILGHKTRSIFGRYNVKNEDDQRDRSRIR